MKAAESFDRRVFGRRRTDISAQVRIGYRVVPCTIKDISEGGALLEFTEHIELPARLWLSWAEQASEMMCEVRHQRRNSVGVQFSRPQSLSLRLAVAPSEQGGGPALAPKLSETRTQSNGASDLVAGMRRAIRQPAAQVASMAPASGLPAAMSEPPRDISTLMQSLKAAAASIVEARAAHAVPKPLPSLLYSGAPVLPPAPCVPVCTVRPLAPQFYAGAIIEPHAIAVPASGVRPLPARALAMRIAPVEENAVRPMPPFLYGGREVLPPALPLPGRVPLPLAASGYASTLREPANFRAVADALLSSCDGHPCAFAVWRSLANLPPRPLPAWAYGTRPANTVA